MTIISKVETKASHIKCLGKNCMRGNYSVFQLNDLAAIMTKKIPIELHSRIVANTVNIFQGDEKDVMIYSLVVTNNSPDSKIYWIDNMVPESVNVAVTRARNTIYIVGNKEYIKANSILKKPLGKLVDYIEKLEKDNFITLENEVSETYKVLTSFNYLKDIITTINIPEEVENEIPE